MRRRQRGLRRAGPAGALRSRGLVERYLGGEVDVLAGRLVELGVGTEELQLELVHLLGLAPYTTNKKGRQRFVLLR